MVEAAKERIEKTLSPLYNMGAYEFERWARMIQEGTNLALEIRAGETKFFTRFDALIMELHDQWKHLFRNKYQGVDWAEKFKKLVEKRNATIGQKIAIQRTPTGKTAIRTGYKEILLEIWGTLHDFKFAANLSVPMTHQLTDEERFKRSL